MALLPLGLARLPPLGCPVHRSSIGQQAVLLDYYSIGEDGRLGKHKVCLFVPSPARRLSAAEETSTSITGMLYCRVSRFCPSIPRRLRQRCRQEGCCFPDH